MADSIFTKIIKRELPATIRYEDEEFIAFDDIKPEARVHVVIASKIPYESLEKVAHDDADFHAHLMLVARKVAAIMGIRDNYRIVMNVGRDVQAVQHFHLHVLGS